MNAAINIDTLLSNGMTAMLLDLGHQLGLFEALQRMDGNCTPRSLARESNLNERYVQEWLAGMVASKVMTMGEDKQYSVEKSVLDAVISKTPMLQILRLFGGMTTHITRCFRSLNPTGYTLSDVPENLFFMDDVHKQKYTKEWFQENVYSILSKMPERPVVLDFGCGTGIVAGTLAESYPSATVTGVDICSKAIDICNHAYSLPNLSFLQVKDGLPASWSNRFDVIFLIDVLHDVSNPIKMLQDVKRVLKKDGIMLSIDPAIHSDPAKNFGDQKAVICYFYSIMGCLPSSMASPPHAGLGAGWGYEAKIKFLQELGFEIVKEASEGDEPKLRVLCRKLK